MKIYLIVGSKVTAMQGGGSKIAAQKKNVFFADFALQNMVETTLPDGRRAYR